MNEFNVGVRNLKASLSRYLRHVKAGKTVVITERGRIIGRIIPAGQPLGDRLKLMVASGIIAWSGKKLELPDEPAVRLQGARTISELLIEDRQ